MSYLSSSWCERSSLLPHGADARTVGGGRCNRDIIPALPNAFRKVVQGYDAFHPDSNFHEKVNIANQNGIVLFPGAVPLYKFINGQKVLVGGLGVSGDGVDQVRWRRQPDGIHA